MPGTTETGLRATEENWSRYTSCAADETVLDQIHLSFLKRESGPSDDGSRRVRQARSLSATKPTTPPMKRRFAGNAINARAKLSDKRPLQRLDNSSRRASRSLALCLIQEFLLPQEQPRLHNISVTSNNIRRIVDLIFRILRMSCC